MAGLAARRVVAVLVITALSALSCGVTRGADEAGPTGSIDASPVTAGPAGAADDSTSGARDPAAAPGSGTTNGDGVDAADGPVPRPLPPAGGVPIVGPEPPVPVSFRLPDLGIAGAMVRSVGVTGAGVFEVPPAEEIGWYRFGSAPGQEGSSVLAAHIAYDGVDGVFRWLATVEPGAAVEVTLDDGSTLRYTITGTTTYDKDELPVDELFDETGPDRLVLITCGGRFNPNLSSYESNVIAFAEPTPS